MESWCLFFKISFICIWLCWVFVAVRALSLLVGLLSRGGVQASPCGGCSGFGAQAPGAQHWAPLPSGAQARGPWHPGLAAPWRVRSPVLGTEPCLLRRQADSLPLSFQGSLASVSDVAHGSRNSPAETGSSTHHECVLLCLCPRVFSRGELQSLPPLFLFMVFFSFFLFSLVFSPSSSFKSRVPFCNPGSIKLKILGSCPR